MLDRSPVTVCFFRAATGRPCPLCGLTRALAHATHGELAQAFRDHPLWWAAALAIGAIGLAALLDTATGADRLGRAWRSCPVSGWLALAFLVAFGLLRLFLPLTPS